MRRTLVFLIVFAVLAACTLHQAAIAAGWLATGRQPGDAPSGTTEVVIAALVALIAGSVALGIAGSRARVAPLLPLAAVGFVVARFYSFDPYYAPALRRMSDGGLVAPGVIYVLVFAAVGVAALMVKWPSAAPAGAAILVISALMAFVENAGH
jgi:hypothetical protein